MRQYQIFRDRQKAMKLVKIIYDASRIFPKEELYGLTQQMRRAVVSIPSNLAEGAARNGAKEYAHFIGIARGSRAEFDTQIQIAEMLGYRTYAESTTNTAEQVGRLLTGLYKKWSTA